MDQLQHQLCLAYPAKSINGVFCGQAAHKERLFEVHKLRLTTGEAGISPERHDPGSVMLSFMVVSRIFTANVRTPYLVVPE